MMVAANNSTVPKNEADAQEFEKLLKQQKLSKDEATQIFGVALSTIWTWHSGRTSIPKAVLMVLRMRGHLELPPPWDNWHLEGGKLVAPSGRALTPEDIMELIEVREAQHVATAFLDRIKANPIGGA